MPVTYPPAPRATPSSAATSASATAGTGSSRRSTPARRTPTRGRPATTKPPASRAPVTPSGRRRLARPEHEPEHVREAEHEERLERHGVERVDGALGVQEPRQPPGRERAEQRPGAPVAPQQPAHEQHRQRQRPGPPDHRVAHRGDRLGAGVHRAAVLAALRALVEERRGTALEHPRPRLGLVGVVRRQSGVERQHVGVVVPQRAQDAGNRLRRRGSRPPSCGSTRGPSSSSRSR